MLAREITEDLHAIRDSLQLRETRELISKGISFGSLTRRKDALWDVSQVIGLPRASIVTPSSGDRPNLIVRPWHQAGNVVSLRESATTPLTRTMAFKPQNGSEWTPTPMVMALFRSATSSHYPRNRVPTLDDLELGVFRAKIPTEKELITRHVMECTRKALLGE